MDKEAWTGEYKINQKALKFEERINKSLELGYQWSFRRSAGQPGIINLAYGLLSASLAKLTDAFVYSDDGAWDYNCFPALADGFLSGTLDLI